MCACLLMFYTEYSKHRTAVTYSLYEAPHRCIISYNRSCISLPINIALMYTVVLTDGHFFMYYISTPYWK